MITGTQNDDSNSSSAVPSWYVPSNNTILTTAGHSGETNLQGASGLWYFAVLQTPQLEESYGSLRAYSDAWTFGQAWVDSNQLWNAVFSQNGVKWNTTRLVAPAQFYVVGLVNSNTSGLEPRGVYDDQHFFVYGSASWQANLKSDTFFLNISGKVYLMLLFH
ncbi:hypothetical protein WJX84_010627 [Apatococcus fuscideae]|uniref:Uncharacterized protein n=1 Tax=Apatococcus fuscideae TaxID=2026836 RepID=A0AAW1TIH3_9CHLO